MPRPRGLRLLPVALALGLAISVSDPSASARPTRPKVLKNGRLTEVMLPGGPITGLVAGGADPDRLWATNATATFWRSDDGGEHWQRLADYPPGPRILVPSRYQRDVLYAADVLGQGIYRSTDAGVSFARLDRGSLEEPHITSLVADPFAASTLYVAGSLGIWASYNGGVRWARVAAEPSGVRELVADPHRPGRLWAAGGAHLWRSDDGGDHWAPVTLPATGAPTVNVGKVALDPHRADRLAVAWSPVGGVVTEVVESLDAGATWSSLGAASANGNIVDLLVADREPGALWALTREGDGGMATWRRAAGDAGWTASPRLRGDQIDAILALADPAAEVAVAGPFGIRRLEDGAWRRPALAPAAQWITALAVGGDEGPPWVYAGTEADGLWRGLVSGESWEPILPSELEAVTRVTAISAVHHEATSRLFVALDCARYREACSEGRRARLLRSDCEGCAWEAADQGLPADVWQIRDVEVDPQRPDTVWATLTWAGSDFAERGGIWRSEDGGRSWMHLGAGIDEQSQTLPEGLAVDRIAVAPDGAGRVVVGTSRRGRYLSSLYQWQPDTESWRQTHSGAIAFLGVAASSGGVFWAGGGNILAFPIGGIYRSLDGGSSWETLSTPFTELFNGVSDIAVSRDLRDVAWVASHRVAGVGEAAGLWRTTDRGTHFEQLLARDGLTALAVFPDDRGVAFVGSYSGLYRWVDACAADDDTLCLGGGRTRVEASWHNPYDGSAGRARVDRDSDRSGVLSFGDPRNPELAVKAVDLGRPGGRPELFVGELTDFDYDVRFTDTRTGERTVIRSVAGDCPTQAVESPLEPGERCVAGSETLCLLGGRLRVRARWENQYDGSSGVARTLPYSDFASWLTFADANLPEILVKALDFGDRILLSWGALTDLGYRLTVDDLATHTSRTYTNPPRRRCGGADAWASVP